MATNRKTPNSIADYLDRFPKDMQALLRRMRATIKKAAPNAEEAISYGIPGFKLNGSLVWFAGYKRHIGFYPGSSAIAAFKNQLSAYKSAKGSVQFPVDEPLPLALVSRIVKFRVKQNVSKAQGE